MIYFITLPHTSNSARRFFATAFLTARSAVRTSSSSSSTSSLTFFLQSGTIGLNALCFTRDEVDEEKSAELGLTIGPNLGSERGAARERGRLAVGAPRTAPTHSLQLIRILTSTTSVFPFSSTNEGRVSPMVKMGESLAVGGSTSVLVAVLEEEVSSAVEPVEVIFA
jgi:hypothetical protein